MGEINLCSYILMLNAYGETACILYKFYYLWFDSAKNQTCEIHTLTEQVKNYLNKVFRFLVVLTATLFK